MKKRTQTLIWILACGLLVSARALASGAEGNWPQLVLIDQNPTPVITINSLGAEGNKYGFEAGQVVKIGKTYHMVISETMGDPARCPEEVKRNSLAIMACKKAVKAHDRLEKEEALRLLEDLKKCKNSFACPHGRPSLISLDRVELARRFHRPGAPPL